MREPPDLTTLRQRAYWNAAAAGPNTLDRSVDEADLVDENARVVVSWRKYGISQPVPPGREERAIALDVLGVPSVRSAILAGEIGKREIAAGAATKVVGFYRLQSLGWYYVVTADEGRLLAPGG